MVYKDKDKQREAGKERQRRYKERQKALLKGVTAVGVTQGVTNQGMTHIETTPNNVIIRTASQKNPEPIITFGKPKRGLDIKYFEDLPPDVQETINNISESNEEKQKRTAAAIRYQHLFPGRYHSTGAQ